MAKKERIIPLNSIGGKIRARRNELGLTKAQLYDEALGDNRTSDDNKEKKVDKWEFNSNIHVDELQGICTALKVDADYLLGRIDERSHEIHEICEITGLSERACDEFMDFAQAKERIRKAENWESPYDDGMPVCEYVKERKKMSALSCINLLAENDVLYPLLVDLFSYIGYANSNSSGSVHFDNNSGLVYLDKYEDEYNVDRVEYDHLNDVSLLPDTNIPGAAHYIELGDGILRAAQIRKIQDSLDSIKLTPTVKNED